VDLLPFLYNLALGNHQWRGNNNDMIYYLSGREAMIDAINLYNNNNNYTGVIQERRISAIPLANPLRTNGCNNNNTGCAPWQLYQPFVFHTADDYSTATVGNNNYQPSHAIAFRTVDQTDVNGNSAPYYPQNGYGGGKLGIYTFWDTDDTRSAPIEGINSNNAPNQYEFYNYSPHPSVGSLPPNPQEVGNQYFDTGNNGNATSLAALYLNDFFNNSSPPGINVQNELYQLNANGGGPPTQQVQAAIQIAFNNYLLYLECANSMTGANGTPTGNNISVICPPNYAP